MNAKTILVTGGSGALGHLLVTDFLKSHSTVILLIRAESQKKAVNKVKDLLKDLDKSLIVLKGDLNKQNLGLSLQDYLKLTKSITHILHAAASTRFTLSLKEARLRNVEMTKRVVSFAEDCDSLERFGFVSTAFIAGKRRGKILEEEFEHEAGFLNTYEQSKYEAEMFVRRQTGILPLIIFRPSLIITPSKKINKSPINALTLGLTLARKGFLPILPGAEHNRLDIVSGPRTAEAIVKLLLKDSLKHLTYHLSSADKAPKLKDFISLIESLSGQEISIRFCGDLASFTKEQKRVTRLRPDLALIYKKTASFLPELAFPKIFDNRNLLEELGGDFIHPKLLEQIKEILEQRWI